MISALCYQKIFIPLLESIIQYRYSWIISHAIKRYIELEIVYQQSKQSKHGYKICREAAEQRAAENSKSKSSNEKGKNNNEICQSELGK
ncbi:hypothetical protein Glove_99g52 [Diversispora epigaea]|uniref:Uncharacterized protein n=1 Tax=Diversispora epigaea TaxID=1348612 RepID=A0A397JEX9_9GLOM|nr:hypothetical protein Glove_99g52 [Diversispora epigaea]